MFESWIYVFYFSQPYFYAYSVRWQRNICRTHKHVLPLHVSSAHCVLLLLMISQLMKPLLTKTEHVPHGTLNTSLPLKGPSTPLSPRFASGCSQEMKAAIRQEASQSAGAASCRTRSSGRVCSSLCWWLGGGLSQREHPKHFNFKWGCNRSSRFPLRASVHHWIALLPFW